MLGAGLDGIKREADLGDPVNEDLYHRSPHKRRGHGLRELPGSLKEAVEPLRTDFMFPKAVLTRGLLEKHDELTVDEHLRTSVRPFPYEFFRYTGS